MAVVLITGCSSGFGLETAVAFAQRGDGVIATVRDPARAGQLQDRTHGLPRNVAIERLDVTDQASSTSSYARSVFASAPSIPALSIPPSPTTCAS